MSSSCGLLQGSFSNFLGENTLHEYISNVSDHWIPGRHGHLSNSLDVEHHLLVGREIVSILCSTHGLHNLGGSAVVQQHIVAAHPESLSESAAVVLPTTAVCVAPR